MTKVYFDLQLEGIQSIIAKAYKQECEVVGHIVSAVWKQRQQILGFN